MSDARDPGIPASTGDDGDQPDKPQLPAKRSGRLSHERELAAYAQKGSIHLANILAIACFIASWHAQANHYIFNTPDWILWFISGAYGGFGLNILKERFPKLK